MEGRRSVKVTPGTEPGSTCYWAAKPGLVLANLRFKDQAGPCLAVQDLGDGIVDAGPRPGLVNDPGPAGRVQVEDLEQVGAGADDRPDDRGAVEHGVETGTDSVPEAGSATSTSRPPGPRDGRR